MSKHPSTSDLPAVLADIEATAAKVRRLLLAGIAPTPGDWLELAEFCFRAVVLCWQQALPPTGQEDQR